ncbi:MAG: electron transfer flavoprotein subunit alpha/FixB family protein [Acutalibacteraceae bacterium]|jgi:electron transfer flavoprotein alpha subunit
MRITNLNEKLQYEDVWVVAEMLLDKIHPVTYELLGAARALADYGASRVGVIVLCSKEPENPTDLFAFGADKVIIVTNPQLKGFLDETEAEIIIRLIEKYKPEIVLGAASSRGRALIPRIAVKANCGLTADCTELGIDFESGDLLQTRPAFGGNIMAIIRSPNHRPQMATVRPGVMKSITPDYSRKGEIIYEKAKLNNQAAFKRIIESITKEENAVNLTQAQIIIAGGRGVKGAEGFDLLRELAAKTGGAVGASRAAVDSGWIPYEHQIGQTGQTVQTGTYIACGISGQIQHLVGMQSSALIIAIDKNPDTPMMQMADIAVIGDLFEIIPALVREI